MRILTILGFCFLAMFLMLQPGLATAETIVIGSSSEATGLDPRLDVDSASISRVNVIMEPLLVFNEDMEFEPRLAEEWVTSDDGLTFTFQLRENVLFHHGREFTADDVKYTIEWVLDENNNAPNRNLYDDIEDIEIVNDHKVVLHLSNPNSFLLNNIARLQIVPHDESERLGEDFGSSPVGTGPYTFEQWRRDDFLLLSAFDEYWGGTPNLANVEFRPIPEDSSRLLAFEAEDIHVYQGGVLPREIDRLEEEGWLQRTAGTGFDYVAFNVESQYLEDRRVRQAISHMINRQGIVDNILEGVGKPAYSNITPNLPWHHPDLEPYEYNPERAKELIEEAGYAPGDITLDLVGSDHDIRMHFAEIIEYELGQIGIEVNLIVDEWGAFLDRVLHTSDYDMFILGWGGLLDPDRAMFRQFHSEELHNYPNYSNERVDELLERGPRVPADSQESLEIYWELQEILYEDLPYAHIYYTEELGVVQPYVEGWTIHPYSANSWMNAHEFKLHN